MNGSFPTGSFGSGSPFGGFGGSNGAGGPASALFEAMDQVRKAFEPRPGGSTRMARGDVRAAVLSLLAEEPMHGYQIIREIEDRSGGTWKPSAGSVYPTLQLLADEGLVAAEEQNGRKTYSLTEAGRATADEADAPAPWEGNGTARAVVTSPSGKRAWTSPAPPRRSHAPAAQRRPTRPWKCSKTPDASCTRSSPKDEPPPGPPRPLPPHPAVRLAAARAVVVVRAVPAAHRAHPRSPTARAPNGCAGSRSASTRSPSTSAGS